MSQLPVILYSEIVNPRFKYIADFISNELSSIPCIVTSNKDEYISASAIKINYSPFAITAQELWVEPHSLLSEPTVKTQAITCFKIGKFKAFFKTLGNYPFDIFAASFYLLSRYEEYLPHTKDTYGRYAYENSLAYKENFIDQPLVNIWINHLKETLAAIFPNSLFQNKQFQFLPTYDIDEAFAYKHKDWKRSAGGALRSLLKGDFAAFNERRKVLNGKLADPYETFDWMDELHNQYNMQPIYFFLVADKTSEYDKNILPTERAMQQLIQRHAEKYKTGIHPSWQSGDSPATMLIEKERLEKITKLKITSSRQHYLRFELPSTYRKLVEAGIREDYSMGYGTINGFRASVASPFYWYDLDKEQTSYLQLFPFCYMDANSKYEQNLNPQHALDEMRFYAGNIQQVNGMMITIWHNPFFGTAKRFTGWKETYQTFIEEITANDNR